MLGRRVRAGVWPQGPCEVAGCGHQGEGEGWRLGKREAHPPGTPHRHKCIHESACDHPHELHTLGA